MEFRSLLPWNNFCQNFAKMSQNFAVASEIIMSPEYYKQITFFYQISCICCMNKLLSCLSHTLKWSVLSMFFTYSVNKSLSSPWLMLTAKHKFCLLCKLLCKFSWLCKYSSYHVCIVVTLNMSITQYNTVQYATLL